MTLSVCIIVKNEQDVIGRCLNCAVKFADEIVVVDTGSTDATVSEVKKYTDNVHFFKWCDDFSKARNYAFDLATCELVMWLDADDVVTDENCDKIITLKNNFKDYDMAFMPYAVNFDGDNPTFVYNRERIFKRSKNYRFQGAVHEAVVPCGKIMYSDATVYHKKVKEGEPFRNLRILQKQIADGTALDPRQKFYYGRELLFNNMFQEAAAVLEDFLQSDGWVVNKTEACLNLCYAYKNLGKTDKSIAALLRSFTFAPPQSEACCILGEYFLNKQNYETAAYWYKQALFCKDNGLSGGFVNVDYGGFIPYIQLCVLYDKLGDKQRAAYYNDRAGEIKPLNESYLNNKKYFDKLGIRGILND